MATPDLLPVRQERSVGGQSDSFRALMAQVPSAVVAVTALRAGRPVGLSVGSFASLSLDPLLVGLAVARTSTSWPQVPAGASFGINLLAEDQEAVSAALSIPGPDKFSGIHWSPAIGDGSPVIFGSLGYLACATEAVHRAGDHDFVVAAVQAHYRLRTCGPLVFHSRRYRAVADLSPGCS